MITNYSMYVISNACEHFYKFKSLRNSKMSADIKITVCMLKVIKVRCLNLVRETRVPLTQDSFTIDAQRYFIFL